MSTDALVGKKILIVEDNYFFASEMARSLMIAGSKVLGPVPNAEGACRIIENNYISAAVLDVELVDGFSFTIADRLENIGVPFIFVSSYEKCEVPEKYREFTWVLKPAEMSNVLRQLAAAIRHAEPRKGMLNFSQVNRAG